MHNDEYHIDQHLKSTFGVKTGFSVPEQYFDELSLSTNWAVNNTYPSVTLDIPVSENGFKIPEQYFENLSQTIETRLQERIQQIDFSQHAQRPGMEVPENYFEDSFNRILSQTTALEQQPQKHIRRSQILRFYRYSSVAALFILAVTISYWVGSRQQQKEYVAEVATMNHTPAFDNLEYSDLLASLQNEDIGDEIYNLATLGEDGDQHDVKSILPAQKSTDSSAENKKEIEDFLIENIDEIEEI